MCYNDIHQAETAAKALKALKEAAAKAAKEAAKEATNASKKKPSKKPSIAEEVDSTGKEATVSGASSKKSLGQESEAEYESESEKLLDSKLDTDEAESESDNITTTGKGADDPYTVYILYIISNGAYIEAERSKLEIAEQHAFCRNPVAKIGNLDLHILNTSIYFYFYFYFYFFLFQEYRRKVK